MFVKIGNIVLWYSPLLYNERITSELGTIKWEEILIGILDELGIGEHHRNILPSWPGLTADKNIQQNGKIYDQDRASGGPSHTYIIRLCVHPCTRHLHVSHKPLQ